jgi:hypothetical protein
MGWTIVVWLATFVLLVIGWVGHKIEPFQEVLASSRTYLAVCTSCFVLGATLLFVIGPVFFPPPLPFPGFVNWVILGLVMYLATSWVGSILTRDTVARGTESLARVRRLMQDAGSDREHTA